MQADDGWQPLRWQLGPQIRRFGFYSELLKRHPAIFDIAYEVKHAVFGQKGAEV